jgi:hypothetical protein
MARPASWKSTFPKPRARAAETDSRGFGLRDAPHDLKNPLNPLFFTVDLPRL